MKLKSVYQQIIALERNIERLYHHINYLYSMKKDPTEYEEKYDKAVNELNHLLNQEVTING